MAKTWREVTGSEEFLALSPAERMDMRQQYFDSVVSPQVPPEDLPVAQEQFFAHSEADVNPQSDLADMVDSAQEGVYQGLSGFGETAEQLTGYGEGFRDWADEKTKAQEETMSPKWRASKNKEIFSDDGQGGLMWGEGAADYRTWLAQISNLVGMQVDMMIPGGVIGKGAKFTAQGAAAYKAAKKAERIAEKAGVDEIPEWLKGAEKNFAKFNVDEKFGSAFNYAGYGVAEAGLAGGLAGMQGREEVMGMTPEVLAKSETYQQLLTDHNGDSDLAKQQLSEIVATAVQKNPALISANLILGSWGGAGLEKMLKGQLAKSRLAGGLKGFGIEATSEGPQGGTEQWAVNKAIKDLADPTREEMEGVLAATANEAIVGGVPGGIGGALSKPMTDDEPTIPDTPEERMDDLKENLKDEIDVDTAVEEVLEGEFPELIDVPEEGAPILPEMDEAAEFPEITEPGGTEGFPAIEGEIEEGTDVRGRTLDEQYYGEPEVVQQYLDNQLNLDKFKDEETTSEKPVQNIKELKKIKRELSKSKREADFRPADILGTIANLGGINRKFAEGIDPAEINVRKGGVRPVFPKNGGMSMDEMGELLYDHGFFQKERPDANEVIDLVNSAMSGQEVLRMEDVEAKAEADSQIEAIDRQLGQVEQLLTDTTKYEELLKKEGQEAANAYLEEAQLARQREAQYESQYDEVYLDEAVSAVELDDEGKTYLELMEQAEQVNPTEYERVIDDLIERDAEMDVVAREMQKLIAGEIDARKQTEEEKPAAVSGEEAAPEAAEKPDERTKTEEIKPEVDATTSKEDFKAKITDLGNGKSVITGKLAAIRTELDKSNIPHRFDFKNAGEVIENQDVELARNNLNVQDEAKTEETTTAEPQAGNSAEAMFPVMELPSYIERMGESNKKLYNVESAIEYAEKANYENVIEDHSPEHGLLATLEQTLHQLVLWGNAAKSQNARLSAPHGKSGGATSKNLLLNWRQYNAGVRAIHLWAKENPDRWNAYIARQKKIGELKTGDKVLAPYGSNDEPYGHPSVIKRKNKINWTLNPDGPYDKYLMPPAVLRPIDEVDDITTAEHIETEAHEAAASPKNDKKPPSKKQIKANNFEKGHLVVQGLKISIENPEGSVRKKGWPKMAAHYGDLVGTIGADGDPIDVFVKPDVDVPADNPVFIINQYIDGKYDESKTFVGFDSIADAKKTYLDSYTKGWDGLESIHELTIDEFKDWLENGDTTAEYLPKKKFPPKPAGTAPEHEQVGVDDRELEQIVQEFNDVQSEMIEGEQEITEIFLAPKKKEVVRLQDKVKVYHKDYGWMTPAEAKKKVDEWEQHALDQYKDGDIRRENSKKIVLSLFDLSGAWSRPWEQAGYQVFRFDIQEGSTVEHGGEVINMGDVTKFSPEFFADVFGDFEGQDIYAILAACPCTDFASSGARHFAAKDADGRTVASVNLVHQTLAAIEYFKPQIWALENPVGRIGRLTGLPPWRLSFDPNHFGENYTKKTLIWGRFDADLPIAPAEPTEGSKMHKKYGGKSMATKNARSVTPEGFAYSFFMANNAADNPVMDIANKFDRLDRKLIEEAVSLDITKAEIEEAVEDFYYQDLNDEAANQAIQELIDDVPKKATEEWAAEQKATEEAVTAYAKEKGLYAPTWEEVQALPRQKRDLIDLVESLPYDEVRTEDQNMQNYVYERQFNFNREQRKINEEIDAAEPDLFTQAPEALPPQTGGEQVSVIPYASGMSTPKDFKAALKAGSGAGVGVDISLVSDNMITEIVNALVDGHKVFIDSGAFRAFQMAQKNGLDVASPDFDKVMERYLMIAEMAGTVNKEMDLMLVMPDVIGDINATGALIRKYKDYYPKLDAAGAKLIVPMQNDPKPGDGTGTHIDVWMALFSDAFGDVPWVAGIPSKAAALSNMHFKKMLESKHMPNHIHILGAVREKAINARMNIIREHYKDDVPLVTADANLLRARMDELKGSTERNKKITEIVRDAIPNLWGKATDAELAEDYAALEDKTYTYDQAIEDSAEVDTIEVNAAALMRDYDERLDNLAKMAKCAMP